MDERPRREFAESAPTPAESKLTLKTALARLFVQPRIYLLQRWNWKSAVTSSAFRAVLFFCVNLSGGFHAARAAFLTELVFRGFTSGFYGALTESFREVEPPVAGALAVMLMLPIANHSLEFLVHWVRGTQKLGASIIASMIFTAFSTLFNWYAMRRGAFIVGSGKASLRADLMRIPQLLFDFVTHVPRLLAARIPRRASSTATAAAPQRSV
jgi:hypothetical protein